MIIQVVSVHSGWLSVLHLDCSFVVALVIRLNSRIAQARLVYNDVTNTRVATGLYPATSIDALCSKSITSCLNTWKTFFNYPTVQRCHFLTLRGKNCKPL